MKIVDPDYYMGWNMSWNLNIFSGPKVNIQCGNCHCFFKARLPLVDNPVVACPNCHIGNRIPVHYEPIGDIK
ncbi:MAG: hypothetical protein ACFFG0_34635 [Candidatus Thorarchaeota archaeon]